MSEEQEKAGEGGCADRPPAGAQPIAPPEPTTPSSCKKIRDLG